jgi:hypothetical protein
MSIVYMYVSREEGRKKKAQKRKRNASRKPAKGRDAGSGGSIGNKPPWHARV